MKHGLSPQSVFLEFSQEETEKMNKTHDGIIKKWEGIIFLFRRWNVLHVYFNQRFGKYISLKAMTCNDMREKGDDILRMETYQTTETKSCLSFAYTSTSSSLYTHQ